MILPHQISPPFRTQIKHGAHRFARALAVLAPPAFLLVLLCLAPAFSAPAGSPEERRPPAFVFVIDATNSMKGRIKGVFKLDMTRSALTKSLSAAPAGAGAALLSFGDQPSRACDDIAIASPLAPASKSALAFRNAFARLEPKTSGRTPILAAASRGARIIEDQGRGAQGAVIIMTDGGDDCAPRTCKAAEAFHASHPNIVLHIVNLRPDRVITAQLQCVATATGGRFTEAQTERQITEALTAALRHVPAAPPSPPPAPSPAAPATDPAAGGPAAGSPPAAPQAQTAPEPAARPLAADTPSPEHPPAPQASLTPPAKADPPFNLTLRATLVDGAPPLTQGVGWRVFAGKPSADADARGSGQALWSGAGAEVRVRLAPGSYYAEASFGLIKTGADITVPASGQAEAVVPLNAGAITVRAVGRPGGAPLERVFYRLYSASGEGGGAPGREVGRSSLPQAVFHVPAGQYRLTAEHGLARAERPVTVTPGAALALDIPMNAGALKLSARVTTAFDAAAPAADQPGAADGGSLAATGAASPSPPTFFYRIYARDGTGTGPKREIARSAAAEPSFGLPQGAYHVSVQYGLAASEKDVNVVAGEQTNAAFALEVGRLILSSTIAGKTGAASGVIHAIQRLPATAGGEAVEIARAPNAGRPFFLDPGAYRIVSQYGRHNARETADITVGAGETRSLAFILHLGEASLALPRGTAGRGVAWTVWTAAGEEVLHTQDRAPRFALKSGAYRAEARSGGKTYAVSFELGDNEKKAVAASAK